MNILWGAFGSLVVIGIAFLLSNNRKGIHIRTIVGSLAIQIIFAFLALESQIGQQVLAWLSNAVQWVISFANEGIAFIFGPLVGDGEVFAFEVLTMIIFFASLISILYYLGIMQWFIDVIGGGLSKLLKTTKVESLSSAANIFVGHTEAPLVIEPYINKISQSELFAVMVGGFGSVAGANLVGYSLLGVPLEYLIAASFMAAPSSLLITKVLFPLPKDIRESLDQGDSDVRIEESEEQKSVNLIDAAASGASTGLQMAIEIAGTLLAFVALVALANGILGLAGSLVGIEGLTIEGILGVILSPIAFVIGVPPEEVLIAGEIIGEKIVINEFVAFEHLGSIFDQLSDKTAMVVTFAISGFANLGSIGIQIGAIGAMAPDRRKEISEFGFKAMVGGVLASWLKAAIAGMFI